jgi:hypothetical protein
METKLVELARSRGRSSVPPPWLALHPLLPNFQWAATLKAALAMILTAWLMLSPNVTPFLRPSLLTPVAAVASVEATLGAAVIGVARYTFGGLVASLYAAFIISVFQPSIVVAALATAFLTFVANYLDLQVKTKRFLQSGAAVILWQWYDKEALASRGVTIDYRYCLNTVEGVAAGCLVGFVCSILPCQAL